MPEWKQERPAAEGMYLRSNPPISHIIFIGVYVGLDGELKVSNSDGGILGTPVSELSDRFWWYGPIPQPPWKTKEDNAQRS